jgi:hypothetical protein
VLVRRTLLPLPAVDSARRLRMLLLDDRNSCLRLGVGVVDRSSCRLEEHLPSVENSVACLEVVAEATTAGAAEDRGLQELRQLMLVVAEVQRAAAEEASLQVRKVVEAMRAPPEDPCCPRRAEHWEGHQRASSRLWYRPALP